MWSNVVTAENLYFMKMRIIRRIWAGLKDRDGISRMMQYVGRRYVPYINYHYGTSGTLWEGRYKASLVQEDGYLLTCMRYIESNPVRANMVAHPREYRWSSYRTNGEGREDLSD